MYANRPQQSSTTAQITSFIGFDTVRLFIKGVQLNKPEIETPTVIVYSNGFGTNVMFNSAHGPRGTRWETATLAQVEAHVKAIAHILTEHITLDRSNPDMSATYNRVWGALMDATIGRLDVAWDLRGVNMHALDVMCPKQIDEKFIFYGRTSETWYWGVRGQARRVRVYDKRQQMLDTKAVVLPFECTRVELEMNGARSVQDHLHIKTLRELLELGTHEAGRRIRKAMDTVTYVKRGGETISPLFSVRGRKPRIARKPIKTRGWKAKVKTMQSTANAKDGSIRAYVFTGRAEPLPCPPEIADIPPAKSFWEYSQAVQDEILERVEMQEREAEQRAADDAEARYQKWWMSRSKETRDLIDNVMMGRILDVNEAWGEALDVERTRGLYMSDEEREFYNDCMMACQMC